jgi:hypothetical protein
MNRGSLVAGSGARFRFSSARHSSVSRGELQAGQPPKHYRTISGSEKTPFNLFNETVMIAGRGLITLFSHIAAGQHGNRRVQLVGLRECLPGLLGVTKFLQ